MAIVKNIPRFFGELSQWSILPHLALSEFDISYYNRVCFYGNTLNTGNVGEPRVASRVYTVQVPADDEKKGKKIMTAPVYLRQKDCTACGRGDR